MIRSNGFENSIAEKLEKIIQGDFESCQTLVGLDDLDKSRYVLSKSFVSISAPSLEGKTQFAFVLEKARPLYFALGVTDDYYAGDHATQPIYLNFKDLNKYIQDFAESDLKSILNLEPRADLKRFIGEVRNKGGSEAENAHILLRITTDQLLIDHFEQKFLTLGLLYKLVKDAKMNYDTLNADSRKPWMQYYANQTNFAFPVKSISEISPNFFKGYTLFLDEFSGHDWAIYIRNLARAAGIRCCCVSSANKKVANLAENHQLRMSGAEGEYVWSIVVTELKLANYQTLNSLTNIDDSINFISENVISTDHKDDKKHFEAFFQDFKQNQIHHLRPGVALNVAEFISSICLNQRQNPTKITFQSFFTDLVDHISMALKTRKPLIETSVHGKAANLSLMLSPSYNNIQNHGTNFSSLINYLENHFYYLINPSDASNWLFLALHSDSSNVLFSLNYLEKSWRSNWDPELTFFKSGEILTILACMNLFNYKEESFSLVLDQIFNSSATLSFDTGSRENSTYFRSENGKLMCKSKSLAEKRDDNQLEVLATLCASQSSHHEPLENKISLKGQSGSNFFMNLLFNLKISHQKDLIQLNYADAELEKFNIQKYLEDEVLIPFLYISNFEVPQVFHEMMENSDIHDRSINMGRLTRTTEQSRIDIEFPYYNLRLNQKFNCKIECKNWKNSLHYSDLLEVIERAQGNNPINITVCNEIRNSRGKTDNDFFEHCCNHRINAYRFSRLSSLSPFSLLPLSNYLSDNPLMIAIVIELKVINLIKDF